MQQQQQNPVLQKWNTKVWDEVHFHVEKDGEGKMYLVQIHKRELKPEDVLDNMFYAKEVKSQLESKKAEIDDQPNKYKQYMEEEYPKLLESHARDSAAFESLLKEMEEIAKPEYDKKFKAALSTMQKLMVDAGYERMNNMEQARKRQEIIRDVVVEHHLEWPGHPMVRELVEHCFN